MEEHTHSPTLPLGNKRWDGKVPTWDHLQSTVKWVRVKLPRPVWYPRPRRSLWRQHIQTEQHRKSLEDLNQLTYVIWVCSIGKQIQQLQISSISSFCKLGREKKKKKTVHRPYCLPITAAAFKQRADDHGPQSVLLYKVKAGSTFQDCM